MSTAVLQVEREVVKCGYCLLVQFMTVSGFCRKCRKELKAEIEAEPVGRPFLVSSSMTWGAQIAQIQSENMQKLAASFQTLYNGFPPAQRQLADGVFRERMAAHAKPVPKSATP